MGLSSINKYITSAAAAASLLTASIQNATAEGVNNALSVRETSFPTDLVDTSHGIPQQTITIEGDEALKFTGIASGVYILIDQGSIGTGGVVANGNILQVELQEQDPSNPDCLLTTVGTLNISGCPYTIVQINPDGSKLVKVTVGKPLSLETALPPGTYSVGIGWQLGGTTESRGVSIDFEHAGIVDGAIDWASLKHMYGNELSLGGDIDLDGISDFAKYLQILRELGFGGDFDPTCPLTIQQTPSGKVLTVKLPKIITDLFTVTIERSVDLETWESMGEIAIETDGEPVVLEDVADPAKEEEFYRLHFGEKIGKTPPIVSKKNQ